MRHLLVGWGAPGGIRWIRPRDAPRKEPFLTRSVPAASMRRCCLWSRHRRRQGIRRKPSGLFDRRCQTFKLADTGNADRRAQRSGSSSASSGGGWRSPRSSWRFAFVTQDVLTFVLSEVASASSRSRSIRGSLEGSEIKMTTRVNCFRCAKPMCVNASKCVPRCHSFS